MQRFPGSKSADSPLHSHFKVPDPSALVTQTNLHAPCNILHDSSISKSEIREFDRSQRRLQGTRSILPNSRNSDGHGIANSILLASFIE